MGNGSGLLVRSLLMMLAVLVVGHRPAAGYFDFPPPTLGALCHESHNIYVLRVEKVSPDNGVIVFKVAEQLKGKHPAAVKLVVGEKVEGSKAVRDWAAEGKTAVLFTINGKDHDDGRELAYGHVCIDQAWYTVGNYSGLKCWSVTKMEPRLLPRYCGSPDKLRDAVAGILDGKEVVVPCLVDGKVEDLAKRATKVQRIRASLKLRDYDSKRDFVGWGAEDEK